MKAKEVLKILCISRPTLTKYVKTGVIKATLQANGDYDYDEESVLAKSGIDTTLRKCIIYGRVSTQKQKKELEKQLQILTEFANSNGYCVDKVYSDIASGLNFDRENFQKILFEVLDRKVKTLIIRDKDILSRVSFEMWKSLFRNFNCEIIVMNELQNNKSEEEEIFEDMISMIHCFATRMHSPRRKKKIQLVVEDLKNELNND